MPAGTREKLLNVAEELFAEKGIGGTSLRVLTKQAGANLAAVHYHFGSKDALLDAVLERRAAALNQERLADLARIETAAGSEPASVEEILTAFVAPGAGSLKALRDRRALLARLRGRIEAGPPAVVEALIRKHFGAVYAHFVEALQRSLPELRGDLVAERFRFCLAALSSAFSENFQLDTIPGHPPIRDQDDQRARRLIAFLAAGLRAPDAPAQTSQ